jgi:hypothetical protein
MRTSFLSQLLLFAFFFIASCNENPKGVNNNNRDDNTNKNRNDNRDDNRFSITGKWNIAEIDKSLEESEVYILEPGTIEFTRDGRYIRLFDEKREDNDYGTYTFNKRTKTLVIISDDDEKENIEVEFRVEFRGNNKIILTLSDGVKITLERN